jgi:hypothetical protein
MKEGQRVMLLRMDEILRKATKHYGVDWQPQVAVGDIGRVRRDAGLDGLFEVAFEHCTIFCSDAMVEWVPTGIEKEALSAKSEVSRNQVF